MALIKEEGHVPNAEVRGVGMADKIPAKFLKLRVLAEVPRTEFMDGPGCSDPMDEERRSLFFKLLRTKQDHKPVAKDYKRKLKFNAALWARVTNPGDNIIGFMIEYKDFTGHFAVTVEETKATEAVMFANEVEFEVRGQIEYIKACCSGLTTSQKILIDELFIQRIQEQQSLDKTMAS